MPSASNMSCWKRSWSSISDLCKPLDRPQEDTAGMLARQFRVWATNEAICAVAGGINLASACLGCECFAKIVRLT